MTVFEKIHAQQKRLSEASPAYMVGEQLKDICHGDPHCAELVSADLDNPDMSLEKAERQIKAWADTQKRVNKCVCVSPIAAEGIIRKFYGLPERGASPVLTLLPGSDANPSTDEITLSLLDLI